MSYVNNIGAVNNPDSQRDLENVNIELQSDPNNGQVLDNSPAPENI